jgi:alpha-galactosidase
MPTMTERTIRTKAAPSISIFHTGEIFAVDAAVTKNDRNLALIKVSVKSRSGRAEIPPVIKLKWSTPNLDTRGKWHSGAGPIRSLTPDFAQFNFTAKSTVLAPIYILFGGVNRNRVTISLSDAFNDSSMGSGTSEETGNNVFEVLLYTGKNIPLVNHETILRIDTRDIPYEQAIADVSRWWADQPGYKPAEVPDIARMPMYSTWYSFHQRFTPKEIVKQCKLSRELGCRAVIVDDGWQTDDNARGYNFCGDWEVAPKKIPSMKDFVADVHELDMKFLLWYSVPHIGPKSRIWKTFHDKYILLLDRRGCGIVDPRYPIVRDYLLETYESAVRNWDLDGLKLDFVNQFSNPPDPELKHANGRDTESPSEGVDILFKALMPKLNTIKKDFMIEFRQGYIGPLMRTYGNIFRAGDCPYSELNNRVRTTDLRLLSGNTAVHSDMIMWHPKAPVESAALQLLHILFAVPQISVLIDKIPPSHREMLKFWLHFWIENRDVLLDGEFRAPHPEILYPTLAASAQGKTVVGIYADAITRVAEIRDRTTHIVNGKRSEGVVLSTNGGKTAAHARIFDCRGRPVGKSRIKFDGKPVEIPVPPSGLVTLTA